MNTTENTTRTIIRAHITNRGFGLPDVGDHVLLDGRGLTDAIRIRRILSTEETDKGGAHQTGMLVEGLLIEACAVEECVSEYIATATIAK